MESPSPCSRTRDTMPINTHSNYSGGYERRGRRRRAQPKLCALDPDRIKRPFFDEFTQFCSSGVFCIKSDAPRHVIYSERPTLCPEWMSAAISGVCIMYTYVRPSAHASRGAQFDGVFL